MVICGKESTKPRTACGDGSLKNILTGIRPEHGKHEDLERLSDGDLCEKKEEA